jgi:hypothetical protein
VVPVQYEVGAVPKTAGEFLNPEAQTENPVALVSSAIGAVPQTSREIWLSGSVFHFSLCIRKTEYSRMFRY